MSDVPDDLELVPDDLELVPDDLEPVPAMEDQGPPLDWAGAKAALDEIAAGVKPRHLGPGAQKALMQALNAKRGPEKIGTLDAMNALGSNMALMGLPQALNPQAKEYLKNARAQHPIAGATSEVLGGAAAGAMLPAGTLSQAAQGGLTAWNMSEADSTPQRLKDAASGAFGAVALPVMMEAGGDAIRRMAIKAGAGGGQALQKLAKLLGHEAPPDYGQMPSPVPRSPRGPSPADYIDPNPAYKPSMKNFDRMAQDVTAQGQNNIRAGDWQPIPKERFNPAALEALTGQQSAAADAARRSEMDTINQLIATKTGMQPRAQIPAEVAEASTKNVLRGSVEPDTASMSMWDAAHMDDFADPMLPKEGPILRDPEPPTPGQMFDRAQDSLDFEALDRIMKGGKGTPAAPKPAAPAVSVDAKRQAIIDAQKANPEALAAFGVDPRKNERGFDIMSPMLGYLGAKATQAAGKAAAPQIDRVGRSIEMAARNAARDPGMLMQLMREGGQLGGAARAMMQAIQAGDQKTLRAQTMLLEMSPEFRSRFAQGTEAQDTQMSAASGF